MNKKDLILKYFQKKDQLAVKKREYQQTISSLFTWLVENDHVDNDQTSKFFPNITCTAKIIAKQEGIISGIEEIDYLIKKYTGLTFKSFLKDGLKFKNHEVIAEITGKSHEILAYERTILNILQRMSGITTETNRLINLIHSSRQTDPKLKFMTNRSDRLYLSSTVDTLPYIAATRKTPWTSLDKKAVAVGGGLTHRLNLSDGILIKDNHLKIISKAIKTPRGWLKAIEKAVKTPQGWLEYKDSPGVEETGRLIEIEVESKKQAHQAIKTFQQFNHSNHLAILLDNFTPSQVKTLLSNLSDLYDLSVIIFEASGGITQDNIQDWAKTGVDILSLGALTHSTRTTNLSLEIKESSQK